MATKTKTKGTVREVGEWGLIEWVRRRMPLNASGLIKGIGDDAAVLIGGEIITTDMLVEKIHFDRKWQDWNRLGRKALSVNLSDIAAMGGFARCAFLDIAVPPNSKWKVVEAILTGFAHAARDYGVAVAGGDTSASPGPIIIAVTVVGNSPRPVLRSGARPGDIVFVSGSLGDAALALRLASKKSVGSGSNGVFLMNRLTDPTPRLPQGRAVGQYASAMIDISDGLVSDLGHICQESSVGVRIRLKDIPISNAYKFVKGRLREKNAKKFYNEALRGGEDYELLFTVPAIHRESIKRITDSVPLTEIGDIIPASEGMVIIGPQGNIPMNPNEGFSHF